MAFSFTKGYLALYNIAQLVGWTLALWQTAHALFIGKDVYATAGLTVRACQGAALLETVHTAIGLSRGSVFLSFLQWFGRSNVLFLILHTVPELWSHWAVPVLFIAWSLADIARYPWYAAASLGSQPHLLIWLRYSAFVPLYPLGIFGGEMPLIWAALPYLRDRKLHSICLPNPYNFAFNYHYFALAGLFVILPAAFLHLYTHMLQQRARRLSSQPLQQKGKAL